MPTNLTMPRLSDTMEVGTIVKWHVKPGQKVKSGDVIADIETDKATMELPTYEDGVVAELAVKEGQPCPVGTVIMKFEGGAAGPGPAAGKAQPAAGATQPAAAAAVASTTAAPAAAQAAPVATNGHAHPPQTRVFASPLARKLAAEAGVDLAAVTGTGPGGRIVRRDVEARAANAAPAAAASVAVASGPTPGAPTPSRAAAPSSMPAPSLVPAAALARRVVPLTNMRRTIAARLVESKTTIPHYQVTVAVRMDALLTLRQQLNDQLAGQGVKLSVNDFLVRACALAMHQHPAVNARWTGAKGAEAIEFLPHVNIGVAIALPVAPDGSGGGLVVATLRHADALGLRQISAQTRALADKARAKGLSVEDMADSTFTISNLGMFGVEHFTAIINPPNAAILAVGAAIKKPVVVTREGRDAIEIGHEMQMTMSSDHRLIDGAMAAAYLAAVKSLLEAPATLLV